MTVYHIWIDDNTRISVNDEVEETEGQCISLRDGIVLDDLDEDDEFDEERLDVPAMEATFAEVVAKHNLNDPEQRAYLTGVFTDTLKSAVHKIAHHEGRLQDHTTMKTLSERYLEMIAAHEKKRSRRHLR